MDKPLIILGCGRNVWDDMRKAKALTFNPHVMLVNHMGFLFPHKAHHFASVHPDWFEPVLHFHRGARDDWEPLKFHKPEMYRGHVPDGADSSLFATGVAAHIGYEKIILCGVPLDEGGHFYDPPGYDKYKYLYDHCVYEWKEGIQQWGDKVRSMSGQTKEWMGEPTEEWLNRSS